MNGCIRYGVYMASERHKLHAAIVENKWYLSERAGHDVGFSKAEQDFVDRFFDQFTDQFRLSFCRDCPESGRCQAWQCYARHQNVIPTCGLEATVTCVK